MKLAEKQAVQAFVDSVSCEGLSYAAQEYPPSKDAPEDLIEAADLVDQALNELSRIVDKYVKKYELFY